METQKIDFIIIYMDKDEQVNNPNQKILKDKFYYTSDNLKYFFRGVEKYAPWVNHIYILTNDRLPAWLNDKNEKLSVVPFEKILPEELAGSHNINSVEMNMHRVEGLSETFVYFKAGNFINGPIEPSFFFKHGQPCAYVQEDPVSEIDKFRMHIMVNDLLMLNKKVNRREAYTSEQSKFLSWRPLKSAYYNYYFSKMKRKTFFGFTEKYMPSPMRKDAIEEFFVEYEEELALLEVGEYEGDLDVNHLLLKYYHYATGNYRPQNVFKYEDRFDLESAAVNAIKQGSPQIINLDSQAIIDSHDVWAAFSDKLPNMSEYELYSL